MFLGTASNVGKTTIASGVCRWLYRRNDRVAPFKALNLSSKSAILPDGTEIGTGQAVQAAACGIRPDTRMNPILLKPDKGRTRCYLRGREQESYGAYQYRERNIRFREDAANAYCELASDYEVIVLEGSGSCCECNLLSTDIANLSMAKAANAPVILVASIEEGGVFASLCGTVALLPPEDRARIRGMIVNKFHGDPASFASGVAILEEQTGIPVLGVLPYLTLDLPKEDGLGAEDLYVDTLYNPSCEAAFDRLAEEMSLHLNMELLSEIIGLT